MMKKRTRFAVYLLIALLYVVVKIAFVAAGYLHPGAIAHGAVPAVVTFAAGWWAWREFTVNAEKKPGHQSAVIAPALVFIVTPIFMILKQGDQWLTEGRLPVLIVYECFAIVQFFMAAGKKASNPPN
jgi:hypothetical protein